MHKKCMWYIKAEYSQRKRFIFSSDEIFAATEMEAIEIAKKEWRKIFPAPVPFPDVVTAHRGSIVIIDEEVYL